MARIRMLAVAMATTIVALAVAMAVAVAVAVAVVVFSAATTAAAAPPRSRLTPAALGRFALQAGPGRSALAGLLGPGGHVGQGRARNVTDTSKHQAVISQRPTFRAPLCTSPRWRQVPDLCHVPGRALMQPYSIGRKQPSAGGRHWPGPSCASVNVVCMSRRASSLPAAHRKPVRLCRRLCHAQRGFESSGGCGRGRGRGSGSVREGPSLMRCCWRWFAGAGADVRAPSQHRGLPIQPNVSRAHHPRPAYTHSRSP
ncbi:uncharacterized protein SETTUDRAFT_34927 [Exserohilum turcica Et28A]|uniref:Uncharacterized protein n=1 Tax=Exserohilum turcicum (strain 28A) TaxID=671987 RepID=R0K1A7_EXST2|nr:uncharacterized protein SETTUDRAFT_34927 [Exserohilum turcica Et28A]EOA82187.1 hypothetical protein SETTUDRAFT_34927 [Exserohilum turcica Et28A]